jgi:Fe2+ transport system protein FeoA
MGFRWRRGRSLRRQRLQRAHRIDQSTHLLSEWRLGAEGVITEVIGSTRLAARLRELGLTPGQRVRVLRAGCPLIVQVGEGRLGMRRRDAATIRVSAVSPQRSF